MAVSQGGGCSRAGRVAVGCCGFAEARAKYYGEFRAVEVQQTFYELPQVATVARWRQEAGPEFLFCMKAWQLITHEPSSPTYRRLRRPVPATARSRYGSFRPTREVMQAWQRSAEVAQAMTAELVLFQCPASFRPSHTNVANLRGFFQRAERHGLQFAWEPRGRWPQQLIEELCDELGLVHAVDPFAAQPCGARLKYFRLHGIGGFRYRYSNEDLARLEQSVGEGPAYVFFNNAAMLEDARRFRDRIGAG